MPKIATFDQTQSVATNFVYYVLTHRADQWHTYDSLASATKLSPETIRVCVGSLFRKGRINRKPEGGRVHVKVPVRLVGPLTIVGGETDEYLEAKFIATMNSEFDAPKSE